MGTRCHSANGISPHVSLSIYWLYVLPRILYGFEAVILKRAQIDDLEWFHQSSIRDLQSLPQRTASCAVHLLAGIPPLGALLDTQLASLLGSIGKDPKNRLLFVGLHQLATRNSKSTSWFVYCATRLAIYGLSAEYILLWRNRISEVKTTIHAYTLAECATSRATYKNILVWFPQILPQNIKL